MRISKQSIGLNPEILCAFSSIISHGLRAVRSPTRETTPSRVLQSLTTSVAEDIRAFAILNALQSSKCILSDLVGLFVALLCVDSYNFNLPAASCTYGQLHQTTTTLEATKVAEKQTSKSSRFPSVQN